jgi:uncharacterized protein (DUF488 family)
MVLTVIYTIGHSTRKIEEFMEVLKKYDITALADIRLIPKSRTNPQFNEEALHSSLDSQGIDYIHMRGLGGFRHPNEDSINTGWRNESFRGYADYMLTEQFKSHIIELVGIARSKTAAIMCSEAVPWRCHRRLVADALIVREYEVVDIYDAVHSEEHHLTEFAKVSGLEITYPKMQ